MLSLSSLGLSVKLKGSQWSGTPHLAPKDHGSCLSRGNLIFPHFLCPKRGLHSQNPHTPQACFPVPQEIKLLFSSLCVTGLTFVWHLNCTAYVTPLIICSPAMHHFVILMRTPCWMIYFSLGCLYRSKYIVKRISWLFSDSSFCLLHTYL